MTYETTGYLLAGLVLVLAVGFGGVTYFWYKNLRELERAQHKCRMSAATRKMLEEILNQEDRGC